LLRLGCGAAAHLLQDVVRDRLDAETHRAQPRRVKRVEKCRIEPIDPGLAFEAQVESARANAVRQRERAIAIHGEQGVAKDDVGSIEPLAECAQLVDDVRTERAR
jgi:hypothetical protein